ncbi:uncharacterized protein SOCEGT47_083930 [Sorangium cellulosum]|uniref:Secreted protein n=1 Tax=Sorangium cellulosum TaxID=56 RepID=A0A4P2QDG5_SORCE|nr:hypothetical protein [Sorangium cellulosum]AUX27795.1 uncharacterized protein SOCEGT47_083930 [Sorangium cellulosum]
MKKIAHWSLAFAAVMSFSASALAIPQCIYKVVQSNGLRKMDTGKIICALAEQSGDLLFDHCAYSCKWMLQSPFGSSIAANMYVNEEVTWENFDCEASALWPATANLSLNPLLMSTGFSTRFQKEQVCRFTAVLDGDTKVVKGVIQGASPLSMPSVVAWYPEAC